jgi:hypothetical protein
LDVLHELEERAVVSVPWHAAPCAVDEDGDEWWERERGWRPSRGGAYLNMMMPPMKVAQRAAPDPAHRSPWWWRKVHLALDGDPPLCDAVEGHADLVLRVGLRVGLRERSRESERG